MKLDRNLGLLSAFKWGFLFLFIASAPYVGAEEIGDNLYVNGFVSQGYMNTSKNNYLVPNSVNGSAAFTEAAITLIAHPMDRLRVGIQFLGRNFGDVGNDQVVIDWAYGDYSWRDQLGIRAGKVKMPFGLYNEGRDVDMLRTSIFLPQSIYDEKMRDFMLSYEGLGVYGNFDIGAGGELDYHVFGGTLTVPDPTVGFWGDLFANVGTELEQEIGLLVDQEYGYADGTSESSFRNSENTQVTFPWIFGGALIWNTPLDGFRLSSTVLHGRYHIETLLRYDINIPEPNPGAGYHPLSIYIDETTPINYMATFSGEFIRNDWNFAAEYYQDKFESSSSKGWYVLAGYQVSRLLALSSYYSDAQSPGGDEDLEDITRLGLPDYYGWQRSLVVSSRFDLTDFWLFKLEYHFIDGVALTEPLPVEESLADPEARHWGMFTVKTTFHF